MEKPVTPYGRAGNSKKAEVEEMFDNIAPKYDLLNHLLTFGIDIQWRKRCIRELRKYNPKVVVDIATGTADFAVAAKKLNPDQIIGIDISNEMLEVGRVKIKQKKLDHLIELRQGDSEALQLEDNSVDAITVGFGVRNFENLKLGLSEMLRVLRPGGGVAILEPSFPTAFPMKQLFQFYFAYITPLIGKMVSGDTAAYTYLPASVKAFPNGNEFTQICKEVGYSKAIYKPLTFGSCSMYILEK
ncbi:MAG: bifunctional demethylmenaquinone methyltransferase/2-methoxy-6-polyprenyl-1,4-benzoquinol methylase UbiE [Bacteroidota bacterium]